PGRGLGGGAVAGGRRARAPVIGASLPGLLADPPPDASPATVLPAPATATRAALLAGSVPPALTQAPDRGPAVTGAGFAGAIEANPAPTRARGVPALEGHFDAAGPPSV